MGEGIDGRIRRTERREKAFAHSNEAGHLYRAAEGIAHVIHRLAQADERALWERARALKFDIDARRGAIMRPKGRRADHPHVTYNHDNAKVACGICGRFGQHTHEDVEMKITES